MPFFRDKNVATLHDLTKTEAELNALIDQISVKLNPQGREAFQRFLSNAQNKSKLYVQLTTINSFIDNPHSEPQLKAYNVMIKSLETGPDSRRFTAHGCLTALGVAILVAAGITFLVATASIAGVVLAASGASLFGVGALASVHFCFFPLRMDPTDASRALCDLKGTAGPLSPA